MCQKIFFATLGLSFSVGLGTLVAPYPVLVIIIVGLIGAIVTFIFGLLKIPGPAAIFFVLSDEMPKICKEINRLQEALSI